MGASLVSALRPYARDLAAQLAPPGSDDHSLEAAAEALTRDNDALTAERLDQEQRAGITWHPQGWLVAAGQNLPREGLASVLRHRWIRRKAPQGILGLADLKSALEAQLSETVQWLVIHDPQGPERMPEALVCPITQKRLVLGGAGTPRMIDRSRAQGYLLWAWLETYAERGVRILMHSERDALLQHFAEGWFSAP